VKTKVFNFYLEKNLAVVFFENDKNLLFGLLELSATEILTKYIDNCIKYKSKLLQNCDPKKKNSMLTKIEKMQNFNFTNIEEFFQSALDFEFVVSLHNGKNRIFYYINTRACPILAKLDASNFQKLNPKNSKIKNENFLRFFYEDVNEPLDSTDFNLWFDNDMGIKEKIPDLGFLEIIVKDHEKIRFLESGFRQILVSKENRRGLMEYGGEETQFFSVKIQKFGIFFEAELVINEQEELFRLDKIDLQLHFSYFCE
jgi:ribosome biogenesis protein Nip4